MTYYEHNNDDDIIQIDDLTERFDNLNCDDDRSEDENAEFEELRQLLEELRGYGGDTQWEGDWYPSYLIRETHFKDYAQQLAHDIGAVSENANWPNQHIDWDAAAEDLKQDYSSQEVSVNGAVVEYLYR